MKNSIVLITAFSLILAGCGKKPAQEYDRLLENAMVDLQKKLAAHKAAWGLGTTERWNVEQDVGNIVFTFPNKVVTCPVQIIGEYDTGKKTWAWAWNDQKISEQLTSDSRKLLELGRTKGYKKLTEPVWACTEDEAWQMAALATMYCNEQGAYRGPSGNGIVFMTFGDVNVEEKIESR